MTFRSMVLLGSLVVAGCMLPQAYGDPLAKETATRRARVKATGENFDPQESDARLYEVFAQADAEALRVLGDILRDERFIHKLWALKKKILREKYSIDWKTPAELNPTIVYGPYTEPRLTVRETKEITAVIQKHIGKTGETLESLERQPDGTIDAWTRVDTEEWGRYTVRRQNRGWKVSERHRVQR